MDKSQRKISGRFIGMLAVASGIYLLAVLLLPIDSGPHSAPNAVCHVELMAIKTALEDYQTKFGNYPVGNQSQIIGRLRGDNPQKYEFLDIHIFQLNTNKECLDPWGTPIAINFSSTNSFVISSAGKDKFFGDADDIIFNSVSNNFVKP